MEQLGSHQRYINHRLARGMRQIIWEGTHERENNSSVSNYLECFDDLKVSAPVNQNKMTPLLLMDQFRTEASIFWSSVAGWADRSGHLKWGETLDVGTWTHMLKGGLSKLHAEINRNPIPLAEFTDMQKQMIRERIITCVPTFLMLWLADTLRGELDVQVREGKFDAALTPEFINDTFQTICRNIQKGKRQPRDPHDPQVELIHFTAKSLAHAYNGIPPAKLRTIMPHIGHFLDDVSGYSATMPGTSRRNQINQRLVTLFSEVGFSAEQVEKVYKSEAYKEAVISLGQRQKNMASWEDERASTLLLTETRLARRLVDGVASGNIKWYDVLEFVRAYNDVPGPLQARITEDDRSSRKFWRRVESPNESREPGETSAALARIALLHELAAGWEGAEVMEPEDAHLKDHYVVAVFPEVLPDGRVIEHAIADRPIANLREHQMRRYALYLWRGENGMTATGRIERTWREVFSGTRRQARTLGVGRILHTVGYDQRTLAYLTDPPKELTRRNMKRVRPSPE